MPDAMPIAQIVRTRAVLTNSVEAARLYGFTIFTGKIKGVKYYTFSYGLKEYGVFTDVDEMMAAIGKELAEAGQALMDRDYDKETWNMLGRLEGL